MIDLYECRVCGILATKKHDKCPACSSEHGNTGRSGTAFRKLRDAELPS